MLPVIALVGRPNVGKSTLFNRFTRSRDALVADQPGLTRDRQYGVGRMGQQAYVVVDTGGLSGERLGAEHIDHHMELQVQLAINEADHVIFLLDARSGLTAVDEAIAEQLRRLGKPTTVVANKSESLDGDIAGVEFHALGLGQPIAISAAHGRGVKGLIDVVLQDFAPDDSEVQTDKGIQIAVVGRPNVGKSTLINRLLGEERVIAFDKPGTTRDSIFIPFEREGRAYTLIDTAGVRRRAKIGEVVEKFSVIKALQAMEQSHVVFLLLDAEQGLAEQDIHLASHVMKSGRSLVLVINKWDAIDADGKKRFKEELERRVPFLDFAEWHFISALHGSGVGLLMKAVDRCHAASMKEFKTSELSRVLEQAVLEHQPPPSRGRRIKLKYAHQGGKNPPIIVVHGNQADRVPGPYKRYLMNRFRKVLKLPGTPLLIEFRKADNPYEGRRNKLTPRQERSRKRLMRHVKKG